MTPTELVGLIGGPDTWCGIGVDLEGCPFHLTPTSFKVACPGMQLFARASYSDLDPTTRFTAMGLIV
jgi:hypothetical protein